MSKKNKSWVSSLSKYLYDVSKALMIACIIAAYVKNDGITVALMLGVSQSVVLLVAALLLDNQ